MHRERAGPNKSRVHRADAAHQPVGRRLLDQLLDGAPSSLRGDHQRTVLDEAPGIAEVGDVLPRRALSGLAPALDGVGARSVEPSGVPALHRGEVGTHVIEIDLRRSLRAAALHLGRFDERQRMALEDRVSGRHADAANDAVEGRGDDVLHLHRFHDEKRLAGAHGIPFASVDADDRSLHGRAHQAGAAVGELRGGRALRAAGLSVMKHGQWIVRVDARPCPPAHVVPSAVEVERAHLGARRKDELGSVVFHETRAHPVRLDVRMA